MKEQSIDHKKAMPDMMDKRDLVNIDLYNNEIKVMEEQLNEAAEKHPRSKEIHKTLAQLKKELTIEKENLERFRKKCDPQEINTSQETVNTQVKNGESLENENFFTRLKAFEEEFKNIRYKVNDFVNRWLQ